MDTASSIALVSQSADTTASSGGPASYELILIFLLLGISLLLIGLGIFMIFRDRKKMRTVSSPTAASPQTRSTEGSTAPLGAQVPMDQRESASGRGEHRGIQIGNAQHIGGRKDQQDSFGLSDIQQLSKVGLLAVVADGMGGLSNGAAYSGVAVQAALQSFGSERPEKSDEATMLRVLKRAKEAVANAGLSDGGTTFIATLIRDRQLHFVSVGDSRICLMRNGGLIQLNREHVYGRELDDLALNGILSEEQAAQDRQRTAITSYLGKQDEVTVDRNINAIPLFSGDKVILMSDGVFGFLPEAELTRLLQQKPMQAAEAVKNAVLAKQHPHQDNMTIIVLEIE